MATFNDTKEFELLSNLVKPNGYVSPFIKKFIKPDARLTSGNGLTSLDDPTYLGFSISFDRFSPLFNSGFTTNNQPKSDPTLLGALGNINIPPSLEGIFNAEKNDAQSFINSQSTTAPSAISYLERVGETKRVAYLKSFIQGIFEISNNRPYYFQGIEGLSEAWNKHTTFTEDPYTGSSGDEGIIISCLEAIDLKMTALFSLYKMAAYDSIYKRQVIPNNLLQFDVTVYIQEIRQFKKVRNFIDTLSQSSLTGQKFSNAFGSTEAEAIDFVNENSAQIAIKFKDCMWVPSESGRVLDTVSNSEMTVASTSIKWKYDSIEIESQFPGLEEKLDDSKQDGNIGNFIKNKAKDKVKDTMNSLADSTKRAATSLFQNVKFGNVYGLRNEILAQLRNPQIVQNALLGASVTDPTLSGQFIPSISSRLFPPAQRPTNSLPTEGLITPQQVRREPGISSDNVFGQGPSGPPPIRSNNIFRG